MDLLGSYGSGSDSEDDRSAPAPRFAHASHAPPRPSGSQPNSNAPASYAQRQAPGQSAAAGVAGGSSLLRSLPKASFHSGGGAGVPLFPGVNMSAAMPKRVVQFRVPISYGPTPDIDDDLVRSLPQSQCLTSWLCSIHHCHCSSMGMSCIARMPLLEYTSWVCAPARNDAQVMQHGCACSRRTAWLLKEFCSAVAQARRYF